MSALPNTPQSIMSKECVAKRLADAHRAAEPAITAVYRVYSPAEGSPTEPLKLIEVNPNTTASGIMPVHLSAHAASGIYYPSIIIEIHPSEFTQLQQGVLVLPHGWTADLSNSL
jgi:hypothetical protein